MTTKLLPVAALLLAFAACRPAPAPIAALDPVLAAAMISRAIAATPARSDSILAANHYTAASFTKVLYDIAADSTSAEAYAVAMK